jgi:hypothetical protein
VTIDCVEDLVDEIVSDTVECGCGVDGGKLGEVCRIEGEEFLSFGVGAPELGFQSRKIGGGGGGGVGREV